jgi:RNA polymerase sigma-70 factor, ECF subfamily
MDCTHSPDDDITRILKRATSGDSEAKDELMARLYSYLHRIAQRLLRQERLGHTLQPTALVNEAYIELLGKGDIEWRDRVHFFACASQVMRRILVDHARARMAKKRGGGEIRVEFDQTLAIASGNSEDVLTVDLALQRLQTFDPQLARLVEMRFFCGLGETEIAEVFGISVRSVRREWATARAWLAAELRPNSRATST